MKHSFTQDATSDVASRLSDAVQKATATIGEGRLERIRAVQKKVLELDKMGVLNRQKFSAATRSDFQRCFQQAGK